MKGLISDFFLYSSVGDFEFNLTTERLNFALNGAGIVQVKVQRKGRCRKPQREGREADRLVVQAGGA